MRYVMRYWKPILALVLADQLIKLVVAGFFPDANAAILPGLVYFRPVLNTNLSWVGNFVPFLRQPALILSINLLAIAAYITGYGFYRFKRPVPGKWANGVFIAGLAAALCSLIDKVFWGGSLDYIQLKGFFTFDLKDCLNSAALAVFLVLALRHGDEVSLSEYLRFCLRRRP